jgi:hypothetical protein
MPRMGIIQKGYTDMLLPGILGLSMTLSSMQAVSLPLVIDFGWSKEIEDRLLAPISIAGVGLEKIIVGVVQAVIAGIVVMPLAWLMMRVQIHLSWLDSVHFVLIALLSSWLVRRFRNGDGNDRSAAANLSALYLAVGAHDLFRLRILSVGYAARNSVVSIRRAY